MRRVLLGDLVAAACCLAGAPQNSRAALASRLITEADAAHRYMKRFARPHPNWGTGSIETRANALKSGPNIGFDLGDTRILAALTLMSKTLAQRKAALALPIKPPM